MYVKINVFITFIGYADKIRDRHRKYTYKIGYFYIYPKNN